MFSKRGGVKMEKGFLSGTDPRQPGFTVLKNLGLTKEEEEFLNGRYEDESMATAARNITAFYVAKTAQKASRAMYWLTVALITATVAQVVVAVISHSSV
jgi:hypothetical protein